MERKIVCAANKHIKGDIIVIGLRHFDQIMRDQIGAFNRSLRRPFWTQGFIDNQGNFLNRKEAYIIAKAANQINRKEGGYQGDELFSDDLY